MVLVCPLQNHVTASFLVSLTENRCLLSLLSSMSGARNRRANGSKWRRARSTRALQPAGLFDAACPSVVLTGGALDHLYQRVGRLVGPTGGQATRPEDLYRIHHLGWSEPEVDRQAALRMFASAANDLTHERLPLPIDLSKEPGPPHRVVCETSQTATKSVCILPARPRMCPGNKPRSKR